MNAAKYYLNATIISNSTGGIHAFIGAEVKLISPLEDHVNVVIVEDRNGKRFPVSVSKLSFAPVPVYEPAPVVRILESINHHKESFLYH